MEKIKTILKNLLNRLRGEIPTECFIKRGMKVGKNLHRRGGVIFDYSHCWHISIGENVTLAPRVHILAHDASTFTFFGYTRVGNVKIGNNVFIGASSVILPNVTIGDNCVIGANSTVTHSIPSNSVAVGSPARVICSIEDYKTRVKDQMDAAKIFDESYTDREGITQDKKQEMVDCCTSTGYVFVK